MSQFCSFLLFFSMLFGTSAHAISLDDITKSLPVPSKTGGTADADTTVAGLKEALSIGAGNAVSSVSATDGYFGNQVIRILLPENIQKVADVLRRAGYQKQVDDFVLSMNRAAEKAAPHAKAIFIDAVKGMTFDDARKILTGGDTAATEYFRGRTSPKLYEAFKPVVAKSVDEVGVTRSYKEMMGKYEAIPFMKKESLDLDHYVTNKGLDGLFYMLGQEEKKIRTDPAARVTDLLKTVFGN